MHDVKENALNVLEQNRVAVFIVAYNAAHHIEQVLRRIPEWVAARLVEIYIIDDSSTDNTVAISQQIEWPKHYAPLHIYRTPYNQGYAVATLRAGDLEQVAVPDALAAAAPMAGGLFTWDADQF